MYILGIYIKTNETSNMVTSTKEYKEYIEKIKNNIEKIKENRQNARYNSLIEQATNKYNEAQDEFNKEKTTGQKNIQDAENKINGYKTGY